MELYFKQMYCSAPDEAPSTSSAGRDDGDESMDASESER